MAFNVNTFRGELKQGGARPSLFEIQLFQPQGGTLNGGDLINKSPFMVRAGQIPSSTLGTLIVPYFGRQIKLAGNRTFEDWTVTIINDVNFTSRTAVEQWMESIQELDSGVGATDLDYLVSRATISQLNRDDSIIATYELYNMYPQTLANIELSYDTADEIQSFDVTFSYSHWERTL